MAFRGGGRGGGGPRLANTGANNFPSPPGSAGSGGSNRPGRGGGPPSGNRGWGSANPQNNGPRGQQQQQSAYPASAAATASAFPSLGGTGIAKGASATSSDGGNTPAATMKDRALFVFVSLVGNTVVAKTKSGRRYVGILQSTSPANEDLGVVLSQAQEIAADNASLGAPIKLLTITGPELEALDANEIVLGEPVKNTADGFRTDVEISNRGAPDGQSEGRLLQKWGDAFGDGDGGLEDGNQFVGPQVNRIMTDRSSGSGSWDQFAANEARFGLKSNYNEDLYTTKLDRGTKDFKAKEKEAERLAAEIMGQSTNNPHMAEERGQVDDSGQNEEDKYGAVVRGAGAYIPPAARRAAEAAAAKNVPPQPASAPALAATTKLAPEVDVKTSGMPSIAVKVPTPTKISTPAVVVDSSSAATAPIVPSPQNDRKLKNEFAQFVAGEKKRIEVQKQEVRAGAKDKAEKEKKAQLADLKNWSSTFQLKTPMPEDVASVIHKSPGEKPRDPSLQKSLSPTTAHTQHNASNLSAGRNASNVGGTASVAPSPSGGAGSAAIAGVQSSKASRLSDTKEALAKMTIPKIPPFNAEKAKARQQAAAAAATASPAPVAAAPAAKTSPTTASKMSAKASSFKPFNPAAASFTPGAAKASVAPLATPVVNAAPAATGNATAPSPALAALAAKQHQQQQSDVVVTAAANNPFFGNRPLRRSVQPLHIRDDFSPFKTGRTTDPATVGPHWPYNGKSYRNLASAPASGGPFQQQGVAGPLGFNDGSHPHMAAPNMLAMGSPAGVHLAGPMAPTPGGPVHVSHMQQQQQQPLHHHPYHPQLHHQQQPQHHLPQPHQHHAHPSYVAGTPSSRGTPGSQSTAHFPNTPSTMPSTPALSQQGVIQHPVNVRPPPGTPHHQPGFPVMYQQGPPHLHQQAAGGYRMGPQGHFIPQGIPMAAGPSGGGPTGPVPPGTIPFVAPVGPQFINNGNAPPLQQQQTGMVVGSPNPGPGGAAFYSPRMSNNLSAPPASLGAPPMSTSEGSNSGPSPSAAPAHAGGPRPSTGGNIPTGPAAGHYNKGFYPQGQQGNNNTMGGPGGGQGRPAPHQGGGGGGGNNRKGGGGNAS